MLKNQRIWWVLGFVFHLLISFISLELDNGSDGWGTVYPDMYRAYDASLKDDLHHFTIDSRSYINSAENFLEYGVFGENDNWDYHRTPGLPLLIALFMKLFGAAWYQVWIVFMCSFLALSYPIMRWMGYHFSKSYDVANWSAFATLALGLFHFRALQVMTDAFFAVLFLMMLASFFKYTHSQYRKYLIYFFVLLLYAASLRPTLMLLAVFVVAYMWYHWSYTQKKHYLSTYLKIGLIGVVTFILSNVYTFKMYNEYEVFTPTNVLGINLFHFTSLNMCMQTDNMKDFSEKYQEIMSLDTFPERDTKRKTYFKQYVQKYPKAALGYFVETIRVHFFYTHYMELLKYFGYSNIDQKVGMEAQVRYHVLAKIVLYLGVVLYAILYLGVLLRAVQFCVSDNWMYPLVWLSLLVFFIAPTVFAFSSERIRLPVEPLFIIWSVDAYFSLWSRRKSQNI